MRNIAAPALLLAGGIALGACTNPTSSETSGGPCATTSVRGGRARQVLVLRDLSASMSPGSLAADRATVGQLVASLGYCDQVVLMEIQSTNADSVVRFVATMPSQLDPRRTNALDAQKLAAKRQSILSVLPLVYDTLRTTAPSTKIFATLQIAAEFIRDAQGRSTTIVLLSDMLESDGEVEMTSAVPGQRWIAGRLGAGLVPPLAGACIVAIGPDVSTVRGVKVRAFWTSYFKAAGATLTAANWRRVVTATSPLQCSAQG